MNTQAIKIIDEMIELISGKEGKSKRILPDMFYEFAVATLWEAKERISSLPSLDIDSLQRYYHDPEYSFMLEDDDGEYVRYDDLVNLIK